jgi:hypothetical protein
VLPIALPSQFSGRHFRQLASGKGKKEKRKRKKKEIWA